MTSAPRGLRPLPAPRPGAASDDELMNRMKADDFDALGELFDRYMDRAYRVAISVCHDRSLAEDAVQESFASIWRSRASYVPDRGTVASWLLTVARHRAIDVGRRDHRHANRCLADDRLEERPCDLDVAVQAADMAEAAHLRSLLAQLPETQQEIITLAFYGQLTHVEIAERLSLPPGTVKGRMRLGLQKLRKCLTEDALL